MKQFFKYFFGILDTTQKKRFFLYLVLLFLGSTSSMLGVGAVIPFVSVLVNPNQFDNINFLNGFSHLQIVCMSIVLLILAFWIKNIIGVALFWFQTKFLNTIVLSTQKNLFRIYISMDYKFHLSKSTPILIRNIMAETNQLSSGIINPLGILMTDLFSCVFIVALLLYINFLFSFFTLFILGIFLFIFMIKIRVVLNKQGKLRVEAGENLTKAVLDGLSGIKEIKLYSKEKVFINVFDNRAEMLNISQEFNQIFRTIPSYFIETIAITFTLVTLLILITLGESTSSIFVLLSVFGVAATQLFPALNRIMQAITNIKYSIPALITIYEEFKRFDNNEANINDDHSFILSEVIFKRSIKLEDIFYNYPDGTQALKNISLVVEKGKKTAFVGPSGSGKSTLVDLLMGFHIPQKGNIYIDNKQIDNIREIRRLFAYIPQQIILYDTSIKENIAFGELKSNIDETKVWKCLEMAQLYDFVSNLNKGLDTFVGENGIRLSGGQRQRLGIARALYQDPQILVMDEATSALDTETEKEVTKVIKELKDITIITIAHRLSTIEGYDKIYELMRGSILE